MTTISIGRLEGHLDDSLTWVVDLLVQHLDADPGYSFQVAAYRDGEPVLDLWAGPRLRQDSLMVPYSVSSTRSGSRSGSCSSAPRSTSTSVLPPTGRSSRTRARRR